MLLTSRRFAPLFITQFFGALNDNLLKNALVMLISFKLSGELGEHAALLVTLTSGIFIAPFFLLSATAGQLADKFDRARLTRLIKLAEIGIMALATVGFYTHSVWVLMVSIFLMGCHSTFFGPIKYALLPQHLEDKELMSGNALVEAGTFLAILIGTIAGGLAVTTFDSMHLLTAAMTLVAVVGYFSSRFIPAAPAPAPELIIRANIFSETAHILGFARQNPRVFRSILGISWFWFAGATYLAQFPNFVKLTLNADAPVVTLLLTIFSVGIGIGSGICNTLLRGEITSKYVPLAALGMAVFGVDLAIAPNITGIATLGGVQLLSLTQFFHVDGSWRILLDLLGISICAGIYIVPLYAILQHDSDPHLRARIIAANNVVNALFMVASALLTLLMLSLKADVPDVFLLTALLNLIAAWFIRRTIKKAYSS